MASILFLRLCLLCLATTAAAHQASEHLVFAGAGDAVTLPCRISGLQSCSSVTWKRFRDVGIFDEVVKGGQVIPEHDRELSLLKNCSLRISQVDFSRSYLCYSGTFNSNVSLQIFQITERSRAATTELHCAVNEFRGYAGCSNTGIQIKWSSDDDTPLERKENRFNIRNESECFSILNITVKKTDHRRKWKCHVFQNEMLQATISYTTTVKGGTEEVFAAVGESLSLSCGNTSSLGINSSVQWRRTDKDSPHKGQTLPYETNDKSLLISNVSVLDTGVYSCSEPRNQKTVLNKIRLHILDVTSEIGQGGNNLTLTCVLTCSEICEEDFNLTWSGNFQQSWQSSLIPDPVNNTLIKRLHLPVLPTASDQITCLAHREGHLVASKEWLVNNRLQTLAWVAIPVVLLICLAAAGLYIYFRRRRKANEETAAEMTHVYDEIQDGGDLCQQRQCQRNAANNTDSFYDLLQAVN